jgi:hypothetical protein
MNGSAKASQPLVKLLQGAFATHGVAEEHGEKVDHLVVPEAAAGKANEAQVMASRTPSLRRWWTMSTTSPSQQGVEGTDSEEVWMITEESAMLVISTSLLGKICILPSKEAHFTPARYKLPLVAQFVGTVGAWRGRVASGHTSNSLCIP